MLLDGQCSSGWLDAVHLDQTKPLLFSPAAESQRAIQNPIRFSVVQAAARAGYVFGPSVAALSLLRPRKSLVAFAFGSGASAGWVKAQQPIGAHDPNYGQEDYSSRREE